MPLEGNTGISAALGYASEAEVWGTSKAPSKWTPMYPGESLKRDQKYMADNSIRAGRTFPLGSLTLPTTRRGIGAISFPVMNQGFGAWLNLLSGQTEAELKPVKIGAGTAYKQVHKIGTKDAYKKSMTVVKAAPKREGGVVPSYCYPGAMPTAFELSVATNGYLVANASMIAKDENQEQTIGEVAYPAAVTAYGFTECVVKIATVQQNFFSSLKLAFALPKVEEAVFLGSSTLQQPLTSGLSNVMLTFDADFVNDTLYKMFEKNESKAVEIKLTGGVASEANNFELKLDMPMCRFEGDSPNIVDMGPVKQTIPLKVEDNGSEAPVTATYVSTDSAL